MGPRRARFAPVRCSARWVSHRMSTGMRSTLVATMARTKDAKDAERVSCMSAKADAENFIAVYPQGVGNPTVWNNGLTPVSDNGSEG